MIIMIIYLFPYSVRIVFFILQNFFFEVFYQFGTTDNLYKILAYFVEGLKLK